MASKKKIKDLNDYSYVEPPHCAPGECELKQLGEPYIKRGNSWTDYICIHCGHRYYGITKDCKEPIITIPKDYKVVVE